MDQLTSRLAKYFPLAATMLACCLTTVAISYAVNLHNHQNHQIAFDAIAQSRISLLRKAVAEALQLVRAQQAVHSANANLSRSEFRDFISPYLGISPEIKALEWIPRVKAAERSAMEARARGAFPNFTFTERDSEGRIVPAAAREEFYPVYYLEPYAGNEPALGYDLGSQPTRRRALERSRDTGKTTASGRIRLVQDREIQSGALVFAPVYRAPGGAGAASGRKENLAGFALAVLQIGRLVERVIAGNPDNKFGLSILIFDASAPSGKQRLYPFHHEIENLDEARFQHSARGIINVADRVWTALAVPVNPAALNEVDWSSWLVLAVGLGLSLLLGIHLRANIMRDQKAELQTIQHNRELSQAVVDLKESEARVRAVVDNVMDGIITIDSEGHIVSANPAAERIFGYSSEELAGRNVKMLMPEPFHSEHDDYISRYLETGAAAIIGKGRGVTGLRRDGTEFPMELNIGEIKLPNQHMFTGVVRDITERHKIDRMHAEFVSMISHELRSPLTSIHGSLGLMAGGVYGDLPSKPLELVQIAYRNSDKLVRLINDVLDLEKLAAGKSEIILRRISLKQLVREALEASAGYAGKFGVRLSMNNNANEAFVETDSDRVMQVFANLLSNAIKYSPENGAVEVSVSLEQKLAKIAVTDHGAGVPEEFRPRLFEKFAQADGSDSRAFEGTGLGLSIAKETMSKLGGSIGFETATGVGSTFYFYLPLSVA